MILKHLLFLATDAMIRRAVSSVYADLQVDLEAFFNQRADMFDINSEEHKLEYMEAYKEYEVLVEKHLEVRQFVLLVGLHVLILVTICCVLLFQKFAAKEGFKSGEEFIAALSAAQDQSARTARMVKMLVAASEYKKFVQFAKRFAKKKQEDDFF